MHPEFGAGIIAWRMRHAVLLVACIRGRPNRDEPIALSIDGEWMHRVIARKGHSTQDRLGLARGLRLTILELVADDLVVDLGIEPILVEPDTGAAVGALREGRTEAHVKVGLVGSLRVLKCDQETALARLIISVVHA